MGGKRPLWRRTAPAILAALLGFGAGVATGAYYWNCTRYTYHSGAGGILYRSDTRTGATACHLPLRDAWTPIADPPPAAAQYSDLPPGTVSVEIPNEKK